MGASKSFGWGRDIVVDSTYFRDLPGVKPPLRVRYALLLGSWILAYLPAREGLSGGFRQWMVQPLYQRYYGFVWRGTFRGWVRGWGSKAWSDAVTTLACLGTLTRHEALLFDALGISQLSPASRALVVAALSAPADQQAAMRNKVNDRLQSLRGPDTQTLQHISTGGCSARLDSKTTKLSQHAIALNKLSAADREDIAYALEHQELLEAVYLPPLLEPANLPFYLAHNWDLPWTLVSWHPTLGKKVHEAVEKHKATAIERALVA